MDYEWDLLGGIIYYALEKRQPNTNVRKCFLLLYQAVFWLSGGILLLIFAVEGFASTEFWKIPAVILIFALTGYFTAKRSWNRYVIWERQNEREK